MCTHFMSIQADNRCAGKEEYHGLDSEREDSIPGTERIYLKDIYFYETSII